MQSVGLNIVKHKYYFASSGSDGIKEYSDKCNVSGVTVGERIIETPSDNDPKRIFVCNSPLGAIEPESIFKTGSSSSIFLKDTEANDLINYISALPGNRIKKSTIGSSSGGSCKAETGNVPADYNPESPSYKYKGSHSETVYSLLNNLSKLQISYKLPTDPDLCGSGGSSPPDFFAQELLSGTDTVKVGNVPVLKNCQRDFLVAAATLNAYAAAGYSRKIGTRSDGKTAAQLAEESAGVMMKNLTAADALKDTGDIAPNGLFALGVTTNCWSGVLYP